ncbi:MurR/RpiR family transcriptional regulator [Dongia sp.]|uniref:MurR/RpiR family transcriptional regulator n=1 Tax=Dongia sp. TaxID=1977262 RepID=UPI0035AD9E6E
MLLMELVGRHDGHLTQTDRRLLDLLLADPKSAAMSSATEIAQMAGTHPSSLVRLAKKLGFAGFPDLRSRLRDEIVLQDQTAARLRRRLRDLPPEAVLESVIEREQANLANLLQHIEEKQIRRAGRMLSKARRVLLFGEGAARVMRDLMVDRLRRVGILAEAVAVEPREAAASLTALAASDLVVAFALARVPRLLPSILAEAGRRDTPSIVLSHHTAPHLRPAPTLLIAAPNGPSGQSQSLVVPVAICHAILLTISTVDGGRSIAMAERYGALRATMSELAQR